jgi:hypothetical protein
VGVDIAGDEDVAVHHAEPVSFFRAAKEELGLGVTIHVVRLGTRATYGGRSMNAGQIASATGSPGRSAWRSSRKATQLVEGYAGIATRLTLMRPCSRSSS